MKVKAYLWSLLVLMAGSIAFVGCSDDDEVVNPTPNAPKLTVNPVTVEATAEGGEFTLNFKVENPTGAKVEAVAEAEWIGNVAVKDAEGVISFSVAANETETGREAALKVSYKGAEEVKVAVKQAAATAPEVQGADFTMRGVAGDVKGEDPDVYVTFFLKAPKVETFRYLALPAEEVKENLTAGFSLADIMYSLGNDLAEHELPLVEEMKKGVEAPFTLMGEPNLAISFIGQVVEADGTRRTICHDYTFGGAKESKENGNEADTVEADKEGDTVAPTATIDGWVGNENHEHGRTHLTFNFKSDVAKKVRYALLSTLDLEDYLTKVDIDRIMVDFGLKIAPKMIKEEINTEAGITIPCVELAPGTSYTFLVLAENGMGKVIEKMELMTEAGGENMGPKVEVESWQGDAEGANKNIKVTFHLQSSTAVSMKYRAGNTTDVEQVLNQFSIEQLCDMMGTVLDEERLVLLRSGQGLDLVFGTADFPIKANQTLIYAVRNEAGDLTTGRADQAFDPNMGV